MKKIIVGIDVGGTKCAVTSGQIEENDSIRIIKKVVFPTEVTKGNDQTLKHIFFAIDELLGGKDASDIVASIGVSCGGPLDSLKGVVLSPPNLPGWDQIPIVSLLEERYHVKAGLQNDANACALAEWKYGAGKGYKDVIFLTFGTGMGAGLILNNKLYVGANDMAGEVGHVRLESFGPVGYGKAGSCEGFCSGNGIAQLARTKVMEKIQQGIHVAFCPTIGELPSLTAKVVAEAAMNGDPLAIEVYRICGAYLGRMLSMLIDILNPQVIVIGSIYVRSKDLIEPEMVRVIKKETLSYSRSVCKIVPAGLGEKIGDIAALSVASYLL